jgi:hypothetical protein
MKGHAQRLVGPKNEATCHVCHPIVSDWEGPGRARQWAPQVGSRLNWRSMVNTSVLDARKHGPALAHSITTDSDCDRTRFKASESYILRRWRRNTQRESTGNHQSELTSPTCLPMSLSRLLSSHYYILHFSRKILRNTAITVQYYVLHSSQKAGLGATSPSPLFGGWNVICNILKY